MTFTWVDSDRTKGNCSKLKKKNKKTEWTEIDVKKKLFTTKVVR